MSGRNAYIGAGEVSALIGKWQQIVGGDWQQIVGADTQYNPYQNYGQGYNPYNPYAAQPHPHHRRHHRHHHAAAPAAPIASPYGYPQYRPGAPYRAPIAPLPYHAPYAQPTTVRDHRRRALAQMAYVRGDTAAIGALALMGAEDAAAAETGVPPVDATIPAPPLPPDPAVDAAADAIAPPTADMAPSMEMAPPHHHHHHGHHHHGHRGGGGGGGYGPPPTAYFPPTPPQYGYPVTPRNMMVDYPPPSRADRVVLPMSSGVAILPNTSAQITSRPQNVAFRPERLIIGGTPGNWIVNDIKVGNRSQFSQSGDVPGEMFAATTIDSFVSFETVQTAMDFVVLVTNVGNSESGEQFVCGVLGTAAI
jgi:hypothetical protein